MTTYMIRTRNVQQVIRAYEYMKRRGVRGFDNTLLREWVLNNSVLDLITIKAIYFVNNVYDGYSSSFSTMVGYDEVIHLEETVTL